MDLAPIPSVPTPGRALTKRQKAAVIVHLLISGGVDPGLRDLPPAQQRRIIADMMSLRFVDRATLAATVAEFASELDDIGLHFPSDPGRILTALDGQLSLETIETVMAEMTDLSDDGTSGPWSQIASLELSTLLALIEEESAEVGAIVLSKLGPNRAAELLAELPDERRKSVALAFARTEAVTPATVSRIGLALGLQSASAPSPAFADDPVSRVGTMLNVAKSSLRNEILAHIDQDDAEFGARVRAAIFTFEDVPDRVNPRDLPRIIRGLNNAQLVTLLGGAPDSAKPAVEFVLTNISARLADQLRDEISELDAASSDDVEAAMAAFVEEVRRLEESGELTLKATEA
ncbi:MAG: FliG C-terminal domain-containing protein [Pseudomonadota bacterium]